MKGRTKKLLWAVAILVAGVALAGMFWVKRFKDYTPAEAVADLRAAVAARHDPDPVNRFLELRYGPMTEPANRQKAFLEFFNVGHIEGMQMIVARMPPEWRQERIAAMARWVAEYRRTMTPQEKEQLRASLKNEQNRRILQHATAKYLSQDVRYRAATAPVITELMTTLAELEME